MRQLFSPLKKRGRGLSLVFHPALTKDCLYIQVQVGCNVKGTHTMLIFNEERSIKGEIHPEQVSTGVSEFF